MQKVYFKTFGCRTNQFDTQIMINNLKDFQLAEQECDADIVVVNSCTVTNGADSSVRGYINSVKRKNESAKVILAGCGAHSKGEELYKKGDIFGVFGHSEKENIGKLLKNQDRFYQIGDLEHIDESVVSHFVGKSRAFIKVQEGCNFRCSYCIIPYVRGNARSLPLEQIKEQVRVLAGNGFGEFILTGTNVGSYGLDIGLSIAKLIKEISQIRGVRRIRIGSLEPSQIDSEFLELLNEPFMAKHLHIALQHTADKMLVYMNRRNSYKEDLELFGKIADYGYALGTDFIVGHPGESDELWSEAIERIKELPLSHIHAFTYSPRDNTPSAKIKERINGKVAKERHRELTQTVAEKNYLFRKQHSRDLNILIESVKDNVYRGYDQYYNLVLVESQRDIVHNWINIDNCIAKESANYATFE
jgi:threonylcarbamoyladenosine tRNA methylthiotransferase MtaB